MKAEMIKRTFTTRTPDKPGAFMRACKVIMDRGGNITRVSYKRGGQNLFIEVQATKDVLDSIEKDLSAISYVDFVPKVPIVLVMEIKIPDRPGTLYPVLEIIDRHDVNISYLNSRDETSNYQHFKIGMEVSDPSVSKQILDEVSELYVLNVVSYNGNYDELDSTVKYIRLANTIQKMFSLDDRKTIELITECRGVSRLLTDRGEDPDKVFDKVLTLAEFISSHRDLDFNPRITRRQLTEETELVVIEPPCGSNTYVLRNGDCLLFVDTGMGIFSDEMVTELWEMFPSFFSMRKTLLVTHADADHSGLLSIMENAEIVVSAKAAARLLDMAVATGDEDPYDYCYTRLSRIITDYVPPEKGCMRIIGDAPEGHKDFSPLGKVEFGDLELELYEGPGVRSKSEMIVFCRSPKMLFTGDIYCNTEDVIPERARFNAIAPFVPDDPQADKAALEDARKKLEAIMDSVGRDGMIVCGGHGAVRILRGGRHGQHFRDIGAHPCDARPLRAHGRRDGRGHRAHGGGIPGVRIREHGLPVHIPVQMRGQVQGRHGGADHRREPQADRLHGHAGRHGPSDPEMVGIRLPSPRAVLQGEGRRALPGPRPVQGGGAGSRDQDGFP
jgi:ACT domain-containing protein